MKKPNPRDSQETIEEKVERVERDVLNAFTVERNTGLADGAGAPGSTAAGDNRAGLPDADADRGRRE
jgi:hypothetical protein